MQKKNLNIALIQANLVWENPKENLVHFDQMIGTISSSPDLIVLPEMFTTGFTMNVKYFAEKPDGVGLQWLTKTAAKQNCVIAGSLLIEESGKYYNRLIWMEPDGKFKYYDKHHLFRMAGEHKVMTAGKEQKIVSLKGWNICLQVCYDLRFPVFSRNRFKNGNYVYDVLLYVANWPKVRRQMYQTLLPARAIENFAFVLWDNRIGVDGKDIIYCGDTQAFDPYGRSIKKANPDNETILEFSLSRNDLHQFREKFHVGLDWDNYQVIG